MKTEMAYYAQTHKAERAQRPALFKLNNVDHEEKLLNLSTLLSGEEDGNSTTVADLPTNEDVLQALAPNKPSKPMITVKVNQLCVTVWTDSTGKYDWYLGYAKEIAEKDAVLTVDHLQKIANKTMWKYPQREENLVVQTEQLLGVEVIGEWDNTGHRSPRFLLKNIDAIEAAFRKHQAHTTTKKAHNHIFFFSIKSDHSFCVCFFNLGLKQGI